jgi:hypothetical protein
MLQLAALAKAANEGLSVDGYDGFQHARGHAGQLAKRLLGHREETLEFSDGSRALLAFDAERLVAADGFGPCSGSFLFDCRRERVGGECLAFRLGLDEGRPLDVEGFPGSLNGSLELSMPRPRIKKSLPEEAFALVRVLAVVAAPEFLDRHVAILGYPVNQRPGRPEGLSELLPQ